MLCFYRSLTQWSWQRKTEPPKSLGRGRYCVWQTDGSIEMLWMSQLGEMTLIPVPAGLSLCLTDLPGWSKWILEAGALDLTGSGYFTSEKVFSPCAFDSVLSRSVMTPVPSPWVTEGHQNLSPLNAKLSDQWFFLSVFTTENIEWIFVETPMWITVLGLHCVWKKSVTRGCVLPQRPGRYWSLLEREKVQYGFKFASQTSGLPHHRAQLLFIRKMKKKAAKWITPTFLVWSNCLRKSGFSLTFPLFFRKFYDETVLEQSMHI